MNITNTARMVGGKRLKLAAGPPIDEEVPPTLTKDPREVPLAEKVALLRPEVRSEMEGDAFAVARSHYERCGAEDPLNRILYTDLKLYMDTDILTKVDRSSMASSLEARVPFLNQVVLEVAAQMPLEMKLRGFTRKHVLRRIMKGVLPDRIVKRSKKGFNIPVAKWFRNELKPLLQDSLAESKIVRQGLFEPAAVSTMLDEHFSGRRDNRKHLWTLLIFQLWYDRWFAPSARPAEAALT